MMLPLHLILEHSDGHCLFLVHFYYFYQTVNGDGKKISVFCYVINMFPLTIYYKGQNKQSELLFFENISSVN
jgi:hypothetical protein